MEPINDEAVISCLKHLADARFELEISVFNTHPIEMQDKIRDVVSNLTALIREVGSLRK